MWYKTAKQGSLWSIVSPTFEQDIDKAFNASIINDTNKLDINKFQENFKNIPGNKLIDYKFLIQESPLSSKGRAHCDFNNKQIVFQSDYINNTNLSELKSTMKHEITHAIEFLLPFRQQELFSGIDQHSTANFGIYKSLPNQKPLSNSREDARYQAAIEQVPQEIDWSDPDILDKPIDKETLEKRKKVLRELDRRKDSIYALADMYYANPSELRAVRSEFDNFFSYDAIILTFHTYYENRENGKEIFLQQLKDLIQTIVSIKDVSSSYQKSEIYNYIKETNQYDIDHHLFSQIIRNLDPQYIRQIAKYLSNLYQSVKDYISSYVPDTSETEVL